MGLLNYDQYDDNTDIFYNNLPSNEDSTFDVVTYEDAHEPCSLFNELDHNMVDSPFGFDNDVKSHIKPAAHPLDRRLLRKAFRCLAIAYHESVRDSVLDSLSAMYNRKHHTKLILNSLFIPTRKKRLKQLMDFAEDYSLKDVLYRWKFYVLTSNELKNNEIKAKLYYESSLLSKYFNILKDLGNEITLKNYKILKLVSIINKYLFCNIILPWYESAKNYKRLELCLNDITNEHNQILKHKAFNSLYIQYNRRLGIYVLSRFVQYYLKKKAFNQLSEFYTHTFQKEAHFDRRLKLMSVDKFFEHWRYLTLLKISTNKYTYKLKRKTFHILKRYAYHKTFMNTRYKFVQNELNKYRIDVVLSKMYELYSNSYSRRRLILNMTRIIELTKKRRGFQSLYEHHMTIEHEMQSVNKAENFNKLTLLNRSFKSLYNYTKKRRAKSVKRSLASINYNRYLCSHVFEQWLKLYTDKLIRYEHLYEQFNSKRASNFKRLYFVSFKKGIINTKRLECDYDSIWKSYNTYLASSVFKNMREIMKMNHNRKLSAASSILQTKVVKNKTYSEKRSPDVDLTAFTGSKLSVQELLACTRPLKSESLSFLLYLLSFKSKFNEVYYSYFCKNDDELLNKLIDKLTSDDLDSIKFNYALLLHETRLLYLPNRTPYSSDMNHYFQNVPSQIVNLLQYLVLDDLFNLNNVLSFKTRMPTDNSVYALEQPLSGDSLMKLPLWRIINLKLLVAKKRKILTFWKLSTQSKMKKKLADDEFYESFSDISKMFTKITFFQEWLTLTSQVIETRNRLEFEKYERFQSHINTLVLSRKALGYLLIYLTYMSSRYTGMDLITRVRTWFLQFIKHNGYFQHSGLVSRYINNHRLFTGWKNFSLWYSKIKRDADEFNRINVLVKSFNVWFTSTAYLNNKRNELGENIKLTSDSVLKYAALDSWYKLTKLRKILAKSNYKHSLVKTMKAWRSYTQTSLLLRYNHSTIQNSFHESILTRCFNGWYDCYRNRARSREMDMMAHNHYYSTTIDKYFTSWLDFTNKKIRLELSDQRIREYHVYCIKKIYFDGMYKYWSLSLLKRRSTMLRSFDILRVMAFTNKFTRLIENKHLEYTKDSMREFYNLLRKNKKYQLECENIMMNHKNLYSILHRMSNVNKDRITQGLRILNANAYYQTRFKLVRKRANNRILGEYYSKWIRITIYNLRWIRKLESVYTYLADLKSEEVSGHDQNDKGLVPAEYKIYQLRSIRAKYLRILFIKSIHHWKNACSVLNTTDEVLNDIYGFAETNRVLEALRILQENFMDKRWNKLCAYRAADFANNINYNLKSKVFNHFKSLIRYKIDDLVEDCDSDYVFLSDEYSDIINVIAPESGSELQILMSTDLQGKDIPDNPPDLNAYYESDLDRLNHESSLHYDVSQGLVVFDRSDNPLNNSLSSLHSEMTNQSTAESVIIDLESMDPVVLEDMA